MANRQLFPCKVDLIKILPFLNIVWLQNESTDLTNREVKKVIHPANFDRHSRRQAHRLISLKKRNFWRATFIEIAEELLLLMETVNQKSNYTQINSKVRELLQLPSAYTIQQFFQIQSPKIPQHEGSLLNHNSHYKKIWNQPMLAVH